MDLKLFKYSTGSKMHASVVACIVVVQGISARACHASEKKPNIEVVVKNPTKGGFLYEGPHYSSADGFLYYVDIIGNKIGSFDTKGNGHNVWVSFSGERVTFIVPISGSSGKEFLIGQGKGVIYAAVDWDLAKVLEVKTVYRPEHQGKFILYS